MSLSKIQTELKAPKSQFNNFGKYKYRSLEDITEAIKPLLEKYKASLVLEDDIQMVGDRIYVKATATLSFEDATTHTASSFAREPQMKKGMDEAQITGATSSYARKYALNGLLALDDTKDADSMDNSKEARPTASKATEQDKAKAWGDFQGLCNSKSVDAYKFLEKQVDLQDANAVHNLVIKWLKNTDALLGQLDNFEG